MSYKKTIYDVDDAHVILKDIGYMKIILTILKSRLNF